MAQQQTTNILPILAALSGLTAFLVYLDTRKHKKNILELDALIKAEQLKQIKSKKNE
jgi:hypothetical protein